VRETEVVVLKEGGNQTQIIEIERCDGSIKIRDEVCKDTLIGSEHPYFFCFSDCILVVRVAQLHILKDLLVSAVTRSKPIGFGIMQIFFPVS
jgi:hypothetical protein